MVLDAHNSSECINQVTVKRPLTCFSICRQRGERTGDNGIGAPGLHDLQDTGMQVRYILTAKDRRDRINHQIALYVPIHWPRSCGMMYSFRMA